MHLSNALASSTSTSTERADASSRLEPARALLTPLWLGSLALLMLNDHVLKGAGVLPGWATGKLSDFAGLIVAPVLFATVLRVHGRRAMALCYAAVGLVFAAIQLSPVAAATWSELMGLFGVPWAITMDPTDLLALGVLPVAWFAFDAVVSRPVERVADTAAKLARGGAVGTGLVACVATSPAPPVDFFYEDIFASAYLHNGSDSDLGLLLRPLRAEVEIDCLAVADDPGALIPESAFGQGTLWSLPPRTTIAANDRNADGSSSNRACSAVHVSGDGIAPMILFWDDDVAERWVPGQILEGEGMPSWGVTLEFEDDGSFAGARDTGPQLHYTIKAPPTGGECVAPDEAARLDWTGISGGIKTLEAVEFGLDGCARLDMSTSTGSGTGYVCMPLESFPFRAGDTVRVSASSDDRSLVIVDEGVAVPRELHLMRGRGIENGTLAGFSAATRARAACGLSVDPDCATTQAPGELLLSGGGSSATLSLEEPSATFSYDAERGVHVQLVYAAHRALIDTSCADGNAGLGGDAEYFALVAPQ